jgi:hypothetical protein
MTNWHFSCVVDDICLLKAWQNGVWQKCKLTKWCGTIFFWTQLNSIALGDFGWSCGATTFSIMTLGITTFSTATLSIMTLGIRTPSIVTLGITTLCIMIITIKNRHSSWMHSKLRDVMLNVIMLSVVMPKVVAPERYPISFGYIRKNYGFGLNNIWTLAQMISFSYKTGPRCS